MIKATNSSNSLNNSLVRTNSIFSQRKQRPDLKFPNIFSHTRNSVPYINRVKLN